MSTVVDAQVHVCTYVDRWVLVAPPAWAQKPLLPAPRPRTTTRTHATPPATLPSPRPREKRVHGGEDVGKT